MKYILLCILVGCVYFIGMVVGANLLSDLAGILIFAALLTILYGVCDMRS